MNMKYYDLLSTTIIGVVIIALVNYFFLGNIEINSIAYLSLGYLVGYFINAIGSLLDFIYFKTIGGMPSDILLTPTEGKNWTGYKRIKFYEAREAVETLKKELNDPEASTQKMFECAMKRVNGCIESRVPVFNAQFVWSRTILTTALIASIMLAFHFYNKWFFWLASIALLFLSWIRFKERGFYYAREVLTEYLLQKNN